MKFTWFNLMPWPYLPDDFREKQRSVWVDIPSRLYDPRKGHVVYHQYMPSVPLRAIVEVVRDISMVIGVEKFEEIDVIPDEGTPTRDFRW